MRSVQLCWFVVLQSLSSPTRMGGLLFRSPELHVPLGSAPGREQWLEVEALRIFLPRVIVELLSIPWGVSFFRGI